MKAMIIADLMMSRSTTAQQFIVPLLIAIFICIGMESLFAAPIVIILSVCYSRMFTLLALDEQNGWQRYRAAMPVSRAQIMAARCIALLILALLASLYSIAITALLAYALPPIMHAIGFATFALEADLPMIAFMVALGLLFTAVLSGATLPLYARFGMTKAIGYLPVLFLLIAMVGLGFLGSSAKQSPGLFEGLLTGMPLTMTLATLAITVVLFILGGALSIALYRKRQF